MDIRHLKEKLLARSRQFGPALVIAMLAGAVGYYAVGLSGAATYTSNSEAETGVIAGSASSGDGSGASNSASIKFGTSVTPPTGFQANCIVKPSVCGYPDETNTGVPPGTVLTDSDDITVTQDGAIVENKNITGNIFIRANNVTIRKVRLTSGDYYPIRYDDPYRGLVVEDSEIIGTSVEVTSLLSFQHYTARRVNIHGAADGFKADGDVVIEDSYVHDLAVNETSHNDGLQSTGGGGPVTFRHNTCKLSTTIGANACMQMGNEWGINSGWLITDNLFDGGGWSINNGNNDTNMSYTNNRFTRNAGYGPGDASGVGVIWSGNYYDDNNAAVN